MSAFDFSPQAGRTPGFASGILGLSSDAFLLLRDLVAERTGVYFDEARRDVFADRIAELVVARGMSSFLDYYYLLRYDGDADRHWLELRDRLAVPETYFWRQAEQFDALVQHIVPAHFRAQDARPLRIWSAACCTGEEPLSIVIALAQAGWLTRAPIVIVASDASPALLARARTGIFKPRAFRSFPEALRNRYFEPLDGGDWRIDPALLARVQWRAANLVELADIAGLATADVVFCRNVFIYFSDDAVRRVGQWLWDRMPTPGYLFLGASESLTRLRSPFELRELGGAFVYLKQAAAADVAPTPRREPTRWPRAAAFPEETR